MFINKEKLRELMANVAPGKSGKGNYNKFAKATNISVGQLHRYLNSDTLNGSAFLGKLMSFCEEHGYDFKDYIFLPVPFSTEKSTDADPHN